MKKTKRIACLFVAFAMLVFSIPFNVFADTVPNADAGAVNAWCEWNYTASTGTLYINTDGELMSAYSAAYFEYDEGIANGTIDKKTKFTNEQGYSTYLPLYLEDNETLWNGENYVRKLVIGNGVTAIVNHSKAGHFISNNALPNLMNVTFEEDSSCKSIGIRAFKACTASEIVLPDGLEIIEDYAFQYAGISNMTLPDTVYSIGKYSFGNISVESFKMPNYSGNKQFVFGDFAFMESEFNEFDFGNVYYIGNDAFLRAKLFKDEESDCELVIPDTVSEIGNYAFKSVQGINSVVIPRSVIRIGYNAFNDTNINSVDFSASVWLHLCGNTFADCKLTKVVFPDYIPSTDPDIDHGSQIELEGGDFNNNVGLKSVVFGSAVDSVGDYPFAGCTNLISVKFNTSVDENGNIQGVKTIGEGFFKDTSVKSVKLPSTLTELPPRAFEGTAIGPVADFSNTNIKIIGGSAFLNCGSLKEIILPEGTKEIYYNAFEGSGLESFTAPSTVDLIARHAFLNCLSLETVDLSASKITLLSTELFANCVNLTEVHLPDTLYYIDNQPFSGCSKIYDSFELPASVSRINNEAFMGWGGSVFPFPESLTTIYSNAFRSSKLTSVNLSGLSVSSIYKNAFYESERLKSVSLSDNLVFIGDYAFSRCAIETLTLPSVERIGYKAFYNNNIKRVVIPENCYEIDAYAFALNAALTYVKLPASVKTLGTCAFHYEGDNLKTVIIETTQVSTESLKKAFTDLNSSTVIYGYEGSSAQELAEYRQCTFVALTGEEPSPEEPENRGTCSGGTWKIEDGVLTVTVNGTMENNVFNYENGESVSVDALIFRNDVTKVSFTSGITAIPDNFLYSQQYSLESVKTIEFPDSLKTIGNNAFRGLCELKSADIPVFVNDIGEYAFAECIKLNVSIPSDSSIRVFKEGVFWKTKITNLTLPLKTQRICKKAFGAYQGSSVSTLVVPSTCTDIYFSEQDSSENAFGFTEDGTLNTKVKISTPFKTYAYNLAKQKGIICDFGGTNIHGYYGIYWDYSSNTWYYDEAADTVYIDSSENCSEYLYYFNGELVKSNEVNASKVVYNEGLKTINGNGSGGTAAVFSPSYIYLPDSLTSIGVSAFSNCTNLKAIEIPSGVTSITCTSWGGPFDNCKSLASIDFKANIYKLPDFLFKNMRSLKYVDLGEHITTIGSQCFRNCVNLQEIIIPDSVRTVNEYAFSGCTMAERLVLGKNLSVVNGSAFSKLALCNEVEIRCSDFSGLNFQPWTTSIGTFLEGIGASTTGVTYRFADTAQNIKCRLLLNVKNIEVGTGVRSITGIGTLKTDANWSVDENSEYFMSYNGALYSKDGNTLLRVPAEKTAIDIKSGTKYIEGYAFTNSKVKTLTLPSGMVQIKDYAFYNASALKRISFPETLGYIGEFAFANCGLLKMLTFPESLRTIGGDAFYNCAQLASIILNEGLQNIGVAAFEKCKSIKSVVFPESVELINDYAFRNCSALEDAYIWYADIGYNAFALTNVTIHTLADINGTVSNAYVYANENSIPVRGYTDADAFYDACEMARDINLGYLGFCEDGHGDIEWLTVYEADCEHDGYIIGVCEYCSEILDERHITACGHQYVETLHIPTTATTRGVNVYTCINCGEKYCQYIDIPANAQQYTTQTVTGRIMIAENQSVTSGKNPARGASIMIDDTVVAKTDDNGYFTVALETGLYEAVIHYSFGFDRTVFIRIEDENLNAGKIYIIGCDFNRDGKLNNLDDNLFKMSMSSMPNDPSYLSYVDMNNDGVINVKDYAILKGCMGIDKATFRYEDIIIEK